MLVIMLMIKKIMGLEGTYSKIPPTVIDDYTKKKYLNMQLKNLRPNINIDNNDKESDEIYQIHIIYDKEYDERYQIG